MRRSAVWNEIVCLIDVTEKGPAHFVLPRRMKSVPHGEIVEEQVRGFDPEIIQRENFREECAADLVSPAGQSSNHVLGGTGIAESGRFDYRADIVVGECQDLLRRPEIGVGKAAQ